MFNIQPIRYTTKLFKPMTSQKLSNFKYLTTKTSKFKIDPENNNEIGNVTKNKYNQMLRPYGWQLPRNNMTNIGISFPFKSMPDFNNEKYKNEEYRNEQYKLNKFVSEHKYRHIRKINDIIEKKIKDDDIIYTLIFSPENIANENQMIELLRLIKFNIYNEKKNFIVCFDGYVLKYSNILFGPINFEICYEKNQSNLYCQNDLRDMYTIIIYLVDLFHEAPPEIRNNINFQWTTQLYMKYILHAPI